MSNLLLACQREQLADDACLSRLVESLELPLIDADASALPAYWLVRDQGVLQIVPSDKKQGGALAVDFAAAEIEYRRQHSGIKQEIAKAVGCKPQFRPQVLDATAGLGGDAYVLACLGCDITLVEQNPVVHALLHDGLLRASNELLEGETTEISRIVSEHMQLLACQSSLDYLQTCESGQHQVVYLDPMFPERKKSAKVKKGMQYFHDIVGLDSSQESDLLQVARDIAEKRVVVKRPKQAPLLADKQPSYQLKGKAVRYDVYVNS